MWSLREPSGCVLMSIKAAEQLYFFHFKPFLSSKHKLYCHLNKYYVLECLLLDSRIFQCVELLIYSVVDFISFLYEYFISESMIFSL